MLSPNDLASIAERVFSASNTDAAARTQKLDIRRVRAGTSSSWRLLHQESPPPAQLLVPLFGEPPPIPERQGSISRVWSARDARLVGRRGLVAEDGALFLSGPVRTETDLARTLALCADGSEGVMLRPRATLEAQLLAPFTGGERRLSGVGLHLGVAAGGRVRPFLLNQFASLLLIAELRPKLDYVVVAGAVPDLEALLSEVGFGGLKIFDLGQLQGVVCNELLVAVIEQDPAGWVDTATIGRMRGFASRAHAKLGPGTHTEPTKFFLVDEDDADRPIIRIAAQRGYQLRGLSRRGVLDQALIMAKASLVATDWEGWVVATLFAPPGVPVLDLVGGDPASRVPLLAGAGRSYAFAEPERAEEALAHIALQDPKAE